MKFIKYFLLSVLFVSFTNLVFADTEELHVIVSTDCATDDLRALCEILAIPEITVEAIITSDGMLHPNEGRIKVLELLNGLDIKNIPVAEGARIHKENSIHHDFLMNVNWGPSIENPDPSILAEELLKKKLTGSGKEITLICMGPLTDIYNLVKRNPELKKEILNIIWYNESVNPLKGTNYEFDKKAVEELFKQKISIHVISNLGDKGFLIDNKLINELSSAVSVFEKRVYESHSSNDISKAIVSGKLYMWDDLLPVYLLYPELFEMEVVMSTPNVKFSRSISVGAVKEKVLQFLSQHYSLESGIVFDSFPADSNLYKYDVREIMPEIIRKYGKEEWRVCVLTNEIHGHLGSYSIVGAKMGIKAREILHADIDRINVVTFAGTSPPFSCMNDGLQISTGATLGLGMIEVRKDTTVCPSAIFSYQGKKIRLTLKKSLQSEIDKDISAAILKYGGLTHGYWELIRIVSLKHWLEFDRNEIFDIEVL